MLEFEIKSKVLNIGTRKGQTVYYAVPKSQQNLPYEKLLARLVELSSLTAGDVSNTLMNLGRVVNESLSLGMSVDLGDLGTFRPVVPSKMMDTPEEVTVKNALKTPKIAHTPKQAMRDAVHSIQLSIDRPKNTTTSGDDEEEGTGAIPKP